MGYLKISKEKEAAFERNFKEVLGNFWKRASIVHHNYGDRFSPYIERVLQYCSLAYEKQTKERKFDVIISILECHWETQLHRQVKDLVNPDEYGHGIYCITITTFRYIYKRAKCLCFFPSNAD
jgi:hypothetical protein